MPAIIRITPVTFMKIIFIFKSSSVSRNIVPLIIYTLGLISFKELCIIFATGAHLYIRMYKIY